MSAVVLVILYILCTVVREILEPRLMGINLELMNFICLWQPSSALPFSVFQAFLLGPLGMVMILEILKQMEELL